VLQLPEIQALRTLDRDGRLLFATRVVRMFAYGFLSVVLALYLKGLGLDDIQVGAVLTATLAGDVVISLAITNVADRVGRRRMLLIGAGLMVLAGVIFALTSNIFLLVITAIIGTISPSGNEVGPFLPIEQAALSQRLADTQRTAAFAWYSLIGSVATAFGALAGGVLSEILQRGGMSELNSYRVVLIGYGFRELGLYRITLSVFSYNTRAIRSYEKVGFVREQVQRAALFRDGERYDMYIMGLLRPEWEAQQTS